MPKKKTQSEPEASQTEQSSVSLAIVKRDSKITEVTSVYLDLGNKGDGDLFESANVACVNYKDHRVIFAMHMKEIKTRFDACKKAGKPYVGYTNFEKLCEEKINGISPRHVRNVLNDNLSGKPKTGKPKVPHVPLREIIANQVKKITELTNENKNLESRHAIAASAAAVPQAKPSPVKVTVVPSAATATATVTKKDLGGKLAHAVLALIKAAARKENIEKRLERLAPLAYDLLHSLGEYPVKDEESPAA
jgi:hypothetical protein